MPPLSICRLVSQLLVSIFSAFHQPHGTFQKTDSFLPCVSSPTKQYLCKISGRRDEFVSRKCSPGQRSNDYCQHPVVTEDFECSLLSLHCQEGLAPWFAAVTQYLASVSCDSACMLLCRGYQQKVGVELRSLAPWIASERHPGFRNYTGRAQRLCAVMFANLVEGEQRKRWQSW